MIQYPKIPYPEDAIDDGEGLLAPGRIYVQEKLDGANFRFTWNEDEGFTFGSRRTVGEGLHEEQFKPTIQHIKRTIDLSALRNEQHAVGPIVLFGEAMIPHTIDYDWERTPAFIGYDVWICGEQKFMHPVDTADLYTNYLGLDHAPLIMSFPADKLGENEFDIPQSAYYDGPAEGIVFKHNATNARAKLVRPEFKERNKEVFGASTKKGLSDTARFVEEYVPPARVRSVVHSIIDNGEWDTLEMHMMEILPSRVIEDMVEEEGVNIFMTERYTVELDTFRSKVSSRCASILKRMIAEQTVGVDFDG